MRYFLLVPSHPPQRGQRASSAAGQRDEGPESRLPVVVVGLGAIGCQVVRSVLRHEELELLAAVDPKRAGQRLDHLIPGAPALAVEASSTAAYRQGRGGVALLSTGSHLESVFEEIERAMRAGLNVVSSCEELANPAFNDPELAERLDRLALRHQVAVLGAGVNPGFVFDRLIATLGGVVGQVRRVEARRSVDLKQRRRSLLAKLGVGLSPAAFDRKVEAGQLGHVGLSESCGLVAEGLGLEIDEVEESIDPILATKRHELPEQLVETGQVIGLHQVVRAFSEGKELVHLSLEMSLEVEEARDWIRVEAEPPIELLIPGGIAGDEGSAWALVHAAPRVAAAEPGLLTVLDLPAGR